MELKKLQDTIPFQWRVQSFSKNKPVAACVAYIDARDVMNLLDTVCGIDGWQSDYKLVGQTVYGGIGILTGNEWVWKWDAGSETAVEAEKGQSSDAFKRAAVKWGVGRFLYEMPIKYVPSNVAKTKDNFPYVVDNNGNRVYDITEFVNKLK